MFAKDRVSQSLIDAVNKVLATESKEPEQLNEAFPTVADAQKRASAPKPSGGAGIKLGTRYGGGRQADEPEKDDDDTKKEPKKREKYGARKDRFTNTKLYKEADDCVDEPKAKEIAKKEVGKHEKDMHKEELKGNQHKIDANKNGEIDSHDFKLLRSKKKKMTEGLSFAEQLIESMYGKKSALPIDEKEMSDTQKKKKEDIVMSMKKDTAGLKKRYGSRWRDVMYATATKQAMKEEAYDEVELDEAKKPMSKDEKDKVVGAVQAAMLKSRGNVIAGRAERAAARLAAKIKHGMKEEAYDEVEQIVENPTTIAQQSGSDRAYDVTHKASGKKIGTIYTPGKTNPMHVASVHGLDGRPFKSKEFSSFKDAHNFIKTSRKIGEEIDPDVRTKDALSGANKQTKQKDDVGPGADSRSTKVKFKGGPMSEEKEEDEGHEDEKEDKALVKKMVKKDALKEEEQLDELSKDTLSSYLKKRGSQIYPRSKNNKGNENMAKAVSKIAKKTNEEIEQIDELKTSTMLRYSTKANKALIGGDRNKEEKRVQGINRAIEKIKTRHTKEEVEQIDELSHGTLRSYVDKAKKENLPGKGGNRGVALLTPGTRDKGVHKAVDRMKKMKTNEDVELDETSHMNKPKKLKSFMAMKKEMIGKAGMTSEKKDEE